MSEDFDKRKPEAEGEAEKYATDEGPDVEAHGVRPGVRPDAAAATEEGPDVEAHTVRPNIRP